MLKETLSVRNIVGRYPAFGNLKPENLIAHVAALGSFFIIRIDDEENSDAWFEITIELYDNAVADEIDDVASTVEAEA